MELLAKVFLGTIIAILIAAGLYYAFQHVFYSTVTEAQAESLVMSDLQNSNPGAVLNITNVSPSTFAGSWHIVVSFITNATSPCPSYSIISFDYPKYGFVYRVENTYTADCNIYEAANGTGFILSSYPVAITKSYDLNISQVMAFVGQYGFHSVSVTAASYNTTTIQGTTYTNIWVVKYSAPSANRTVSVVLAEATGNELTAYNTST